MRNRSHAGYRLGIINPLTLVGNELKDILRGSGIVYERISLLSSLEDETGALTDLNNEAAVVQRVSDVELDGLDLVFFCGPGEDNLPWIERHRELGFIAIDLSQPSVADGTPVVAGVNVQDAPAESVLISPHPIATPLIMLLSQIRSRTPVQLCAATVIQPASEYGQAGIDELLQQTIHVLNVQGFPKEIFPRQLAFNLYPAAEGTRDEQYAAAQVKAVLGGALPISLAITQGTTFHSHSFSVFVKTEKRVSPAELAELLSQSSGIEVADGDDTFSTVDASGRDQILIGRVQEDPSMPGAYWIWLVSDNVRRSSALNAVLVAEEVLARFRPIAH